MATQTFRGPQCVNLARRRTVAAWIESLTGIPVPASCDYSFRAALQDGVLLCKLMNRLKPFSVPKVTPSRFSTEHVSMRLDGLR